MVDNKTMNSRPEKAGAPFIELNDIDVADASWLKLKFYNRSLEGATLTVTAPSTGQSQTLNDQEMVNWNWNSELFQSNRLRLQLQYSGATGGVPNVRLDDLVEKVIIGTGLIPSAREREGLVANREHTRRSGRVAEEIIGVSPRSNMSAGLGWLCVPCFF
jgi:hypothetical protein